MLGNDVRSLQNGTLELGRVVQRLEGGTWHLGRHDQCLKNESQKLKESQWLGSEMQRSWVNIH